MQFLVCLYIVAFMSTRTPEAPTVFADVLPHAKDPRAPELLSMALNLGPFTREASEDPVQMVDLNNLFLARVEDAVLTTYILGHTDLLQGDSFLPLGEQSTFEKLWIPIKPGVWTVVDMGPLVNGQNEFLARTHVMYRQKEGPREFHWWQITEQDEEGRPSAFGNIRPLRADTGDIMLASPSIREVVIFSGLYPHSAFGRDLAGFITL